MLFAMSITMMLVATVLPIYQTLQLEQHVLQQSMTIQSDLHDLLLEQLVDDVQVYERTIYMEHHQVNVFFEFQNEYVEGCAKWTNAKNQKEELCLYGIKER